MPSAPGCALLARLKSVRWARRRVWRRKGPALPRAHVHSRRCSGKDGAKRGKTLRGRWRRSVGSHGAFFAARFAGDGRRSRGGPRWGGTGAFAFRRMRLRPGNARFFCGAKSRLLMAAGMAGQGNGRALFPHAAFDGSFRIGRGRSAPCGGFFAARFAGDGKGVRAEGPGVCDRRVRLWEDVPAPRGCPFLLRREESFVDGCGDGGPREKPRALSTCGF